MSTLTLDDAADVLRRVTFRDWTLEWSPLHRSSGDYAAMRWVFDDPVDGLQKCRRWLIDLRIATKSDLVQTALAAALAAAEHEARESFRYAGRKIYGPHFDPDALVALAGRLDNLSLPVKTQAETGAEATADYPDWDW